MRKLEFLAQLRKGLSGLPGDEIEERLTFYSEMIADRMEEGLSEEEAVAAAGSAPEIAAQIAADTPPAKNGMESTKPKRRPGPGEILLLVLGSPLWLSLGIAGFAVMLSLYISLWAVILSLWAVFASLVLCAAASVPVCIILAAGGHGTVGAALLAAGLVCAGLSIFMFFGCLAATKGTLVLTKKLAVRVRNRRNRKEEA